jgi:hypothetical protein
MSSLIVFDEARRLFIIPINYTAIAAVSGRS